MFQKRNHNIHWLCQLGVYVLSRRYAIPTPIVSQSIRPCMQFNHGLIWRIQRAVLFFVLSFLSSSPKQRDGNHTKWSTNAHAHTPTRLSKLPKSEMMTHTNLLYNIHCNNENFLSLSRLVAILLPYHGFMLSCSQRPWPETGNRVLRKGFAIRRTGTRRTDQPGWSLDTTWRETWGPPMKRWMNTHLPYHHAPRCNDRYMQVYTWYNIYIYIIYYIYIYTLGNTTTTPSLYPLYFYLQFVPGP